MPKTIRFLQAAAVSAACVLTACQSPQAPLASGRRAGAAVRDNCCSLLHQLLEDQKDVSLLRFIKPEHADVKDLIKRIAADSGAGSELLADFARHDASFHLDDIRLPPGEAATRAAIADTKKKELLGQSGDEFEMSLLLTQTEALSYAWHLANVAAENETHPDRARALADLGKDMENLWRQVFGMLLAKRT